MMDSKRQGIVYIVGAGPGDHRLITKWGLDLIKTADIILYDRLVNPSLLSYSREDTELIYVGKSPDIHHYTQEEINERLIISVQQGKTVVRLKGGDPYLYGRGGEEALELLDKGIEFRVVPGITSVLAAASYAGIPVTQRGVSSSFHVFSGHDINTLDFETISSLDGTLLFVMGLRNLQQISSKLIEYGVKKTKPAAVIHYGTTASQQLIKADLNSLYRVVRDAEIKSPVLIIIGKVVNLAGKLNWYQKGTLAGKRIMITRSREQQFELGRRIEELGGEPFFFPTIDIKGPILNKFIKERFLKINQYDWIFFSSRNTVRYSFEIMNLLKIDIRSLIDIKFAVVGPGTANTLEQYGIYADLTPEENSSLGLAEEFLKVVKNPRRIFIPSSNLANTDYDELLEGSRHFIDRARIYRTHRIKYNREITDIVLQERTIDLITFTSPSTVKNLTKSIDKVGEYLKEIPTVCIGPVTAETARNYGFKKIMIAEEATIQSMLEFIRGYF